MIDDDDVTIVALLWPEGGGCFGVLLFLLVVGGLAYVACQNDKECAAKTCPTGQVARVIEHECVCVGGEPKP